MAVGGQHHAPVALPPGKGPGTHHTRGWMGPRASLDERKISPPTEIRSLDHPLQSSSKRNSHQTVPCPLTCRGVANQCKGLEASYGSRKSNLVRRVHAGRHGSLHQKLLNPDGSFRTTGSP